MARLTAQQRRNLPSSAFADPNQRAYPIQDPNHAKAARSLVNRFGSPAQKQQVRSKVAKRFGIGDAEVAPSQETPKPKAKRRKVRRKPTAY